MKIINKIVATIKKYDKIAIFTHKNLDGDSYSSSYGLALAIKEQYPQKKVHVFTDLDFLKINFPFLQSKKNLFGTEVQEKTLGIIGDTAIESRIQFFDQLKKCEEIICFDHHQNETNFNPTIYWKDPTYPASSLQAIEIALALRSNFKEATAIALLFGILTDTGFFKYSTNNTKAPMLYAKLLAFASDQAMNNLFIKMHTKTKTDIAILKHIYSNITFKQNLAYLVFDEEIVKKYNYTQLKIKISTIANIEGYDYWAFFIETNENGYKYKVSLRTAKKDVNKIATKYNGGGHIKAAGCFARNDAEMGQIINEIIKTK